MITQDTGGPAFPLSTDAMFDNEGMTLRDYFAAKAMQGILFEGIDPEQTAKHAYDMADAMLKARSE
jgi:predicted RNA polymerase sigma factor